MMAGQIVYGFDTFDDGTSLTTQYAGATFTQTSVYKAGFSLNDVGFPPRTGDGVAFDDGGPISIGFATPVFSAGGYFTYTHGLTVEFFDSSDNLLATRLGMCFTNAGAEIGDLGSSLNEFLQFVSPTGNISRVTMTSVPTAARPPLTTSSATPAPTPLPRLVPAYTDFKPHDVSGEAEDVPVESLDMNWPVWAPKFAVGNWRFLTRRLWGIANAGPYFHHGMFSTMRQAELGHAGEALDSRKAYQAAAKPDQEALIEFLKSLQALPPSTAPLVVDEKFQPKHWGASVARAK